MKFATAKEHRNFFNKHQWLEVEELLSGDQLNELLTSTADVLSKRMHVRDVFQQTPERIFVAGRDLWRDSPTIKKLITNKAWAEIASELFTQNVVRLGSDQLFPFNFPSLPVDIQTPFKHLLATGTSLEAISSLQGNICGLLLCLKGEMNGDELRLIPKKPGNGVFFHPDLALDFSSIPRHANHLYLLIVYTKQTAVYVHKATDPNGHYLQHLGYAFGDKLNDKLNPIISR